MKIVIGYIVARAYDGCDEAGYDGYWDVDVTVDGVAGTVSIEANGRPCAGAVQPSDWASDALVALGSDVLDEVRAVAAQAVQS